MLAACSDKDIAPDTGGGINKNDGSGFVSIQIGLPTTAVTRGANDNFDDGLASEYDVKKVGILFFTGREENAKFLKAYDCPLGFETLDPEKDQVTSIHRVVFSVDITENSESLWALAVVNYNKILRINEAGDVTILADGTSEIPFNNTKSIEDFLALTTAKNLSTVTTTDGFFMTNTPYTTAPGTGDDAPTGFVHLLAAVDKEKIKKTEEEARNNPAAEIFVERAVAKVSVVQTVEDLTPNALPDVNKIEWVIDNTEPNTFVVRHLDLENVNNGDATAAPNWLAYTHTSAFTQKTPTFRYRFVGNTRFNYNSTEIYPENLDMYRIYFGVDPQGKGIEYDENSTTMKVLKDTDPNFATAFKATGATSPQYCFENTFDVKHMDYYNTTRALFKVTFAGGDFFTRGIDRKTRYVYKDAASTMAHFAIENSDVVAAWTNHFNTAQTITITDLNFVNSNGIRTATNNWVKITFDVVDGRLVITDLVLYDGTGQQTANIVNLPTGVNLDKVLKDINDQVTFNAYIGGVAYYAVRIKHFGDDLTPWIEPKDEDGNIIETPSTNVSYSIGTGSNALIDANKNYLGRYGVLRNNWYELNISQINKFGEPTVGDLKLDETPDDKNEPEQAIACKINILSWAKRTQSVKF